MSSLDVSELDERGCRAEIRAFPARRGLEAPPMIPYHGPLFEGDYAIIGGEMVLITDEVLDRLARTTPQEFLQFSHRLHDLAEDDSVDESDGFTVNDGSEV